MRWWAGSVRGNNGASSMGRWVLWHGRGALRHGQVSVAGGECCTDGLGSESVVRWRVGSASWVGWALERLGQVGGGEGGKQPESGECGWWGPTVCTG